MDRKEIQIIKQSKLIIFDADGVLVEDGTAIKGVPFVLSELKKMNKQLIVFSNNSTTHPKTVHEKMKSQGIDVDEVITSSFITAKYCNKQSIKTVFVIGEDGLKQVLQEHNVSVFDYSWKDPIDEIPDAVIVGMDRTLNYGKLAVATQCVLRGSKFIATNPDKSFPTPRGQEPGAGSMIAALETASGKSVDIIIGKPSKIGFQLILEKYNCKKDKAIMIGDRFETDILGAKNAQILGIVVNTGIATSRNNPGTYEKYHAPVIETLESLIEIIKN